MFRYTRETGLRDIHPILARCSLQKK